ncbi:hypothetical protein HDU78_011127, partial [Chytriomyces hyalinus]
MYQVNPFPNCNVTGLMLNHCRREHGKALLKALKETAACKFEGIVKGSACQLRSAKTPPSDSGNDKGNNPEERDDHDEEADNAETELTSSDVEEEHLGVPLTGRPLKP